MNENDEWIRWMKINPTQNASLSPFYFPPPSTPTKSPRRKCPKLDT